MDENGYMLDDLVFALENVFERGRELEQARERVKDSATPSYWMADEAERYDEAKKIFMQALDRHIDQRVAVILQEVMRGMESVE